MEEVGGSAQILEANNGGGARFELRLPLHNFEKLIENHFATVPGTFLNRVRV